MRCLCDRPRWLEGAVGLTREPAPGRRPAPAPRSPSNPGHPARLWARGQDAGGGMRLRGQGGAGAGTVGEEGLPCEGILLVLVVRRQVHWSECVLEHVIRHALTLRDSLGLIERPVNAQVDSALSVLLLGLGE